MNTIIFYHRKVINPHRPETQNKQNITFFNLPILQFSIKFVSLTPSVHKHKHGLLGVSYSFSQPMGKLPCNVPDLYYSS